MWAADNYEGLPMLGAQYLQTFSAFISFICPRNVNFVVTKPFQIFRSSLMERIWAAIGS